jgi:hypothetical protein
MGVRYSLVEVRSAEGTHYRIFDSHNHRYFRRAFRTQKDALFFITILNKADRDKVPDESETTKTEDDNE